MNGRLKRSSGTRPKSWKSGFNHHNASINHDKTPSPFASATLKLIIHPQLSHPITKLSKTVSFSSRKHSSQDLQTLKRTCAKQVPPLQAPAYNTTIPLKHEVALQLLNSFHTMSSNPSFANSNTTGASVPDSFLDPLRIVIGNPAIIALVEGAMKNDVSLDELIDQHIVAFTVGDRELYRPSYLIAVATCVLAQTKGDVLLHATNNITPYANTSQWPRTIPECALKELGLTSQHELAIAELHGLPNYLVSLVCSSRHELKARFGKFQALVQGAIFWLALVHQQQYPQRFRHMHQLGSVHRT